MELMKHQVVDSNSNGAVALFGRASGKTVMTAGFAKQNKDRGTGVMVYRDFHEVEVMADNLSKLGVICTLSKGKGSITFENGNQLKYIQDSSPYYIRFTSKLLSKISYLVVDNYDLLSESGSAKYLIEKTKVKTLVTTSTPNKYLTTTINLKDLEYQFADIIDNVHLDRVFVRLSIKEMSKHPEGLSILGIY